MVVIFIVMTLTLVAGHSYRKHIIRAKLVECITHIQYLRRLALDHFYNEGQYPTPATFLTAYRDDPKLIEYTYAVLLTGGAKNCVWADSDKGHGNDCDRRDEQNPGASTGSSGPLKYGPPGATIGGDLERSGALAPTALRYGFEVTCTHDHFPVAEYVYANSLIPNAVIVQMTTTTK